MRGTRGAGFAGFPLAAQLALAKAVTLTLLLTVLAGLLGMHALSTGGPAGAPMLHSSALLSPGSTAEGLSPGVEPGRGDSSVDIPLPSSFESSVGVEQVGGPLAPLNSAIMLGVMACLVALLGILVMFVRSQEGGWVPRPSARSGTSIRRPDPTVIRLTPSLVALSIDRR